MLGVPDSCRKEIFLKSQSSSLWIKIRPLMKSYLRSCLLLLNQVTDTQIIVFILSRVKASAVFFSSFPSLKKLLIKISIHLWVTGEEDLSLFSFSVVLEIVSKLHSDWYDTCLMKTYKAFVGQSKFFDSANLKRFQFLENSIVELYSFDLQNSYHHILASLQQLAYTLSQAIKTKKKEELIKVCNWQYINSISLWVKFLVCNLQNHDLLPLFSLSVVVINGIVHLFPGHRYFPLRFRCVQMLNQLSLASGIFVPVVSLVLDFVEHKVSNADSSHVKSFNYSSVLKVPKYLLKQYKFQEECILSAIELLSAHFSTWSYHISFPELAATPLMFFKRLHEKLTNEALRRQVKRFIDQVELNKEFIERKRGEASFSPNNDVAIDSFLLMEKNNSRSSFTQYYVSVQQKSQSMISSNQR
ncbi:hypothetical protein HPP92_011861 [Vanilla planifolia]|uniref:Nucleolar complex protein 2 homolog n=1 Tax=Vanilla planifolia TaxID=51239 RepID=A0A835RD68_VANPL|nr:hypothetical protein HPP92_011861 [Vanilla planifolia]